MTGLRKTIWLTAILCAGFGTSCLAQGGWDIEPIDSLLTVQGRLQIDQVGDDGYRLTIDGHFIVEFGAFGVEIDSAVPSGISAQYILLKIDEGGGSCPQLYRLLDLTPGQKPYLTHEFGNCSAEAGMTMQGENVAIIFSKTQDSKARTTIYQPDHRRLTTAF